MKGISEFITPKLIARFWKYVDVSGATDCWEWKAYRNPKGYGIFAVKRIGKIASVVSWEINIGQVPDGLCALHDCDNPPCVNPGHLFLGTRADNMHDMARKNRAARQIGERNGLAKLTDLKAKEIYENKENKQQRERAKIYGVSQSTIAQIDRGIGWKHINP